MNIESENENIKKIRHSMAHIMALSVLELFPKTKLGFGPSIEDGFYYDFDLGDAVVENKDLKKIEKLMKKRIAKNIPFEKYELDLDMSLAEVNKMEQSYKVIQIEKLKNEGNEKFSFYKTGEFVDLCEGPHVENTKELINIAFKIERISGAYWLGSEKNKMLTRIYALCFNTKEELNLCLENKKKAKEFDHKKLGKELDLFFIDDSVGKGLILWTPNGTVLREEVEKFAKEIEFKYGYKRVFTPHISKEDLFLRSGHLPAYKESMFPPMTVIEGDEEKEKFYLKPMNCPYHHLIYANQIRSYRDLPYRLAEYGTDYRFERSGELSGLIRVRSMTMNDAHSYVMEENLKDEIQNVLKMYQECYTLFGLKDYYYRFSTRGTENTEKFIGDKESWDKSEKILKNVLEELNIPYKHGEGEAAFYGPKIDIQFKNLSGREETVSTIQIDFQGPIKFDLSYVSKSGELKRPVIIHRAPLSTHERFLSFLIEYYGGAFPTWLSPTQVMIIPVGLESYDFCSKIKEALRSKFVRAETDFTENSLNKKIRTNIKQKIPILLIIGKKERENNEVTIRRYGQTEQQTMLYSDFENTLIDEIKLRKKV